MAFSSKTEMHATLRAAQLSDAQTIRDIYAHYEKSSSPCGTAESIAQREEWLAAQASNNLPVVVAELHGEVVGWASLSLYQSRCELTSTVEPSIYLAAGHTGRGLGKLMMTRLMEMARDRRYHCLVAVIWSDNLPSLEFARSLGFERAGELKEVAFRSGHWLDITLMQKMV